MTLEKLREKNPGLNLYSVLDPEFRPYGRVIEGINTEGLSKAILGTPLPDAGVVYEADEPTIHSLPSIEEVQATVFGGMTVESGYCNGHSFQLNALEYHKCSEVNYSPTGCVLLLALFSDISDRRVCSDSVIGFWLPPEVMIEVYPLVLHFAPCRTENDGFRCLVVLEQGTNTPIDHVDSSQPGENGLLWMRNKWLITHPDYSGDQGAFVGISGENVTLHI